MLRLFSPLAHRPLAAAALFLLTAAPLAAQITIERVVIGQTPINASGGTLTLDGIIGDPIAGEVSGGTFTVEQGAPSGPAPVVVEPGAPLLLTVMLQGAYDAASGAMRTDLRDADLIPLAHPFSSAAFDGTPLDYDGPEATTAQVLTANAVVDWVLVELRAAPDAAPEARFAALLLSDGSVVSATGGPPVVELAGLYYAAVWHRNHLAGMTPTATTLDTADLTAALFGDGGVEVASGVFALVAGDGDADGSILGPDQQDVWFPAVGLQGYAQGDFTLDGSVLGDDEQNLWRPNVGQQSAVPGAYVRPEADAPATSDS